MRSDPATNARTRGLLAFRVGGFAFGARVEDVAGLLEARPSPIPRQRAPLAGVLAFRGAMVPAFDLIEFLELDPPASSARYAMVLTRGADSFGVLVPTMPRLIYAKELREADLSVADPELGALIETVYESGGESIHCLNYWSVIDSILPDAASEARAGVGRH